MNSKKVRNILICTIVAAAVIAMPLYSCAAKPASSRLKDCLQKPVYSPVKMEKLNLLIDNDKDQFKKAYENEFVVFSSGIKIKEKKKDEIIVVSEVASQEYVSTIKIKNSNFVEENDGRNKEIDLNSLDVGDAVAVYGKVSMPGVLEKDYEIEADVIRKNPIQVFQDGDKIIIDDYFVDHIYRDEDLFENIIEGGGEHLKKEYARYYTDKEWNATGVCETLTANSLLYGRQYYLNMLLPQNTENGEVFYIFHFEYEKYIKNNRPDVDSQIKSVEKEIIKNILQDKDLKISIMKIKDVKGSEMHYCNHSYSIGGKEYKLEFIFRPDKEGITCMLYTYFPDPQEAGHVCDVAYLIENMRVNN